MTNLVSSNTLASEYHKSNPAVLQCLCPNPDNLKRIIHKFYPKEEKRMK
ncbi:hypothetical protein BOVA604_3198 [Bacteroides ovatus]|nr:hypothetical protein BOVA604_3198 [Bacteroides ovatus]